MTAASEIVNTDIARPAYIGLPCSREPGRAAGDVDVDHVALKAPVLGDPGVVEADAMGA